MKYVDIYVYGNYWEDMGCGQWLVLLRYGSHKRFINGKVNNSSVNRTTLTAICEGLRALKEPCNVTVYTQCDYIPKTFELGWKRKSNADLWALIDDLSVKHTVCYKWYKGIKAVFADEMKVR